MHDNKKDGADRKQSRSEDDVDTDTDNADSDTDAGSLKPVRPKVGESDDNLRQRSEWFQKRSGKR
jgi:hypothetical protein